MLPAYYIEEDCEVTSVRIYTETAPTIEDARFEVYDDGVSIMSDHSYNYDTYKADTANYTANTYITLPQDATTDEMAEDFDTNNIDAESWVTCKCIRAGGAKNITIQLELDIIE